VEASTTTARPELARGLRGADAASLLALLGVLSLALIPVRLHRAFDLPLHPLLLHVPVILVPILALGLLLAAARFSFFERHALGFGLLTVVSLASTILTVGAGQAFRADRGGGPGDEARRLNEHAESGETLRIVMILVAALVLFAVALTQAEDGSRLARLRGLARSPRLRVAIRALFAIGAVVAAFFVIRTGHLGAQLTWGKEGGGPPPGHSLPGGAPGGDGDGG
jgi:hypothetical protein